MAAPKPKRSTCRVRHNVPALRIRRTTSPENLAQIDWILFRKNANPYPRFSARAERYKNQFHKCRESWKPLPFDPLPHTTRRA